MRSDATSSRDRPLQDRRVAVTRPADARDRLAALLQAAGADVTAYPLTRIEPPADDAALDAAARDVAGFDWVVFTSANAVAALAGALHRVGTAGRAARVAAVGSGTAAAVRDRLGWPVTAMPDAYAGDELAAAMQMAAPLAGRRVLWPRAAEARPALGRDLAAAGAEVLDPVAYRTVPDHDAAVALHARLRAGTLDVITFAAPSAVRCFADLGSDTGRACVAVIGRTTAAAARDAGLHVHVQPAAHTFPDLVAALAEHFRRRADP